MFETAMFYDLMEKLVKKCHENSKSKGFWTGPEDGGTKDNISLPCKIALMHSELSELLETYRKGNPPCSKTYVYGPNGEVGSIAVIEGGGVRTITSEEEELADLFIRLCDYCGYREIDLLRVTFAKMDYNSKRPHMHGKNC